MNTEISKQFVSYEIAVKLKELGFNEPCIVGIKNNESLTGVGFSFTNYNNNFHDFVLPIHQQVIDWLRKEHNIQFNVSSSTVNGNKKWVDWIYNIRTINGGISLDSRNGLDSYEEAREMGILKVLELI